MNENLIYQIWLNLRLNHDHNKIDKAIRLFGNAENIYRAEKLEKTECEDSINELRAELRAKGLMLHEYQRTLNSIKYN